MRRGAWFAAAVALCAAWTCAAQVAPKDAMVRATVASGELAVSVAVSAANASLSSLRFRAPGGAWAASLVLDPLDAPSPPQLSGTAVVLGDGAWAAPRAGPGFAVRAANATAQPHTGRRGAGAGGAGSAAWINVTGLELVQLPATGETVDSRVVARENWTIRVQGAGLRWAVSREFAAAGGLALVAGDRTPALVFRTVHHVRGNGETPIAGAQIPSLLDPTLALNGSAAFRLGGASSGGWYEGVVPAPRGGCLNRSMLLVPSRRGLRTSLCGAPAPAGLAFGHPPSDGTTVVSLGGETVDRRALQPARRAPGERQLVSWSVTVLPVDESPRAAPFALRVPRYPDVAELATELADISNTWFGWIFGNNPASVPCLHEMGYFPLLQGMYRWTNDTHAAMEQQLRMFAGPDGVAANGRVMPRWTTSGFYNVTWGPLQDQMPHFLIAVHAHAMNGGDVEFVRQLMPVVDRVASFMLHQRRLAEPPYVYTCPATGLGDGGRHASNWYDVVEFGHHDAQVAAFAVWALRCVAELKAFAGDPAGAASFDALAANATAGYNATFWDDDAGFFRDWVDVEGRPRTYLYVDQQGLAVMLGIASAQQAERIFAAVDAQRAHWRAFFNVSEDDMWATPSSLFNASAADLVGNGTAPQQTQFPQYENGDAFIHTTAFELAARAMVPGQQGAAWSVLTRALRVGFNATKFWGAALHWAPPAAMSSEPLTSSALVAWALVRSGFGVWPTLTRGLLRRAPPLPQLAGAQVTFRYLGRDTTLTVSEDATWVDISTTS